MEASRIHIAAFIWTLLACSSVAPAGAADGGETASHPRQYSSSVDNASSALMKTADVIVIGAGVAGLAAAANLSSAGMHVIVLEARARIGGRIWTTQTADGVPIDMGAMWMHGTDGNPIWDEVERKLEREYPEGTILFHDTNDVNLETYYPGGTVVPEVELLAYQDLYTGFQECAASEKERIQDAGGSASDMSLQIFSPGLLGLWEMSPTKSCYVAAMDKFLRGRDALTVPEQQGLDYNVQYIVESEYAADIGQMSTAQAFEERSIMGPDRWFRAGYVQVADYLARGLDIRLSSPVKGVSYNSTGVAVELETGATFTAPHVIVTVPLGVLKRGSIAFSPPLPAAKRASIAALGMGLLDKVALVFNSDEVFWREDLEFIDVISTEKGVFSEFHSLYASGKLPILVAYNQASYARTLENMTDGEIVAAAMTQLRSVFGKAVPEPQEYHISRWGKDPFARGSYSFWATNSSQADNDRLAEPIGEGRVLFAGEATSDVGYFATVHGAYWSGQREAQRVLNANSSTNSQPSPQDSAPAASPQASVSAASPPASVSAAQGTGHSLDVYVILCVACLLGLHL